MCHPAVTRVSNFKVQFGWHSSHSVSVESCLRCSETGCTTWLLQPAGQPALHLLNLIRTMNTHVIMLCSNVHYLHLANCEGHDFLFSVQNELGTAGRAVRAVWRLPHWRRPDFLVPFVAVHVLDLHFATSRLMGWLRKDTLPSHVICSSILRFAVCHGCKQSVVPRRLLVMWCEKKWHNWTLLLACTRLLLPPCLKWTSWGTGMIQIYTNQIELRCSQLQVLG